MTAQQKAHELVDEFRNILMDEDTECGNEILCTHIAIKHALIVVREISEAIDWSYEPAKTALYWDDVRNELNKLTK